MTAKALFINKRRLARSAVKKNQKWKQTFLNLTHHHCKKSLKRKNIKQKKTKRSMSKTNESEYKQSSESEEEECKIKKKQKRKKHKMLKSLLVNQAAVRVKLKTPLQNVKR